MVIWFIKSFFVYFFCVFLPPHLNLFCFCYVFNVSSFIMPILAWNIPFLEEISNLSILLFSSISLHCSLKKAFLSLLAILGTLHSDAYIFPFLLCFSPLFFSQLFVRPRQTAILLFCISFPCAKVGSQETSGVTGKFGLGMRNEAGQRLIEFCQENALVIANTLFQQHKRRLCTWTSPDGQHWNQIDYILCSQRWRSPIQSAKTRPGADCGSDHELLIAKFRLKLKKVGKATRPFRYDLNQIPYDYTVEVRNRFKGLDLIDRVPDEL